MMFRFKPVAVLAGMLAVTLVAGCVSTSDIDGSAGSVDEVKRIVARIQKRWPKTRFAPTTVHVLNLRVRLPEAPPP